MFYFIIMLYHTSNVLNLFDERLTHSYGILMRILLQVFNSGHEHSICHLVKSYLQFVRDRGRLHFPVLG